MRIAVGSLALFVASIAVSACLPAQRPDVTFAVETCDGAPSGGSIRHNACLRFDGRDSHSFTGTPSYLWTAQAQKPDGTLVDLPDFTTAAGTASLTVGTSFFATELAPVTTVFVTLTVRDGIGLERSATRQIELTNVAPTIENGDTFLRSRSASLFLLPFVVAHVPIADPDGDLQALDVTQIEPAPGPGNALQYFRCSDLPSKVFQQGSSSVTYPDPSDGDPNALCFAAAPLDDAATTSVNEAACDTTDLAHKPCLADPFFEIEIRNFVFRVKVREENQGTPDPPGRTNCTPAVDPQTGAPTEVVGCITVRVDDVLWTASSQSLQDGLVSRVAAGWNRGRPPDVVVRNGLGATDDPNGNVWLAGQLQSCFLEPYCFGGLVGIASDFAESEVVGLGDVADVQYAAHGPSDVQGLWVSALSLDSNANPAAANGGPVIPAGVPYDVFIPYGVVQTNQITNLTSAPAAAFTFVTGFSATYPDDYELPDVLAPAPDGGFWFATTSVCSHFDAMASACNPANTALASKIGLRLRRAPPMALGTVVDASTLPDLNPDPAATPPGYGLSLPTVANDVAAGVYVAVPDVTGAAGYASKIYHLDSTGAQDSAPIDFPEFVTGVAAGPDPQLASEQLWLLVQSRGDVYRVTDPSGNPTFTEVPGETLTFPQAMRVDGSGNLWVDDHLNDFTRRVVTYSVDGSEIFPMPPFGSTGRGIAVGTEKRAGNWHGDTLDLVRQPRANPVEVPASVNGPLGASLAGMDPTDGAVYGFSPYVTGAPNVFRVTTDGRYEPLMSLAFPPACGTISPELPRLTQGTNGLSTPGTLWLCVSDGGLGWNLAQVDLRRLRQSVRDGLPVATQLPVCTASTAPDAVCSRALVPLKDANGQDVTPVATTFSFGDFELWLLGKVSGVDGELVSVIDPELYGFDQPPFVSAKLDLGPSALSFFATQPLAGAFENETTTANDATKGGVWLLEQDDAVHRFAVMQTASSPFIAEIPALLVPPRGDAPPGSRATAVTFDFVSSMVWRSWTVPTASPAAFLDRTFVEHDAGVAAPCGAAYVPSKGEALAPASYNIQSYTPLRFSGSVWVSGDDQNLVRVRGSDSPIFQGDCATPSLEVEYWRQPDTTGSSALTPGGRSLTTGGP